VVNEVDGSIIASWLLNDYILPAHREAVLDRVMACRAGASREVKRFFERAARPLPPIPGFRSLLLAPDHLLRPFLADNLEYPPLAHAILSLWYDSQRDLHLALQALIEEGVELEVDWEDGEAESIDVAEAVAAMVRGLCEIHPEHSEEDVGLFIHIFMAKEEPTISGKLRGDRAQNESEQGDKPREQDVMQEDTVENNIWGSWLETLRALPPEAPEWDEVDAFVAAVTQLRADKKSEAVELRRAVDDLITGLLSEYEASLQFFGLEAVTDWRDSLRSLETATLRKVEDSVKDFRTYLQEYTTLRSHAPTSLAEERSQREHRGRLEETILQQYEALRLAFFPDATPPPPAPDGGNPQDQAEDGDESDVPALETGGAEVDAPAPEGRIEEVEEPAPEVVSDEVEEWEPSAAPDGVADDGTVPPSAAALDGEADGAGEAQASHSDDGKDPDPEPDTPPAAEEVEDESSREGVVEAASDGSVSIRARSGVPISETPLAAPDLLADRQIGAVDRAVERDEQWNTLLWTMVEQDDLTGAYWLASSLMASDIEPAAPPWLLAAVQAARWLDYEPTRFVSGMYRLVSSNPAPEGKTANRLLVAAAALRPILLTHSTDLLEWLQSYQYTQSLPALQRVVGAAISFAQNNLVLHPADAIGATEQPAASETLEDVVETARQWLDEVQSRRTKFKRAADVWRAWIKSPDGDLFRFLRPVIENQAEEAERVLGDLQHWRNREVVLDRIDRLDTQLTKHKRSPIIGPPQQYLLRMVEEACKHASAWHHLVVRARTEEKGDWRRAQVEELRSRVEAALPDLQQQLEELTGPSIAPDIRAGALCLWRAIHQLQTTLHLSNVGLGPAEGDVASWSWLPQDADSLRSALNRRLLMIPGLPLTDDGELPPDHLSALREKLWDGIGSRPDPGEVVGEWLAAQDYRFVESLLPVLPPDERGERAQDFEEHVRGSRATLKELKEHAESEIEQAVVDGLIAAEERSQLSLELDQLVEDDTLNFPPLYQRLQKIQHSLQDLRTLRIRYLSERWRELDEALALSDMVEEEREQVQTFFKQAFDHQDTRVIEAALDHLKTFLAGDAQLDRGLFSLNRDRKALDEFLEVAPRIERWLEARKDLQAIARTIESGGKGAGMSFSKIPKTRRQEASTALQAWRRLKQHSTNYRDNSDNLARVLDYLGFTLPSPNLNEVIKSEGHGMDWQHLRITMSASTLARPIPQFGSQAQGTYDIVCLWERPGAGTIGARLQELRLGIHSVLVFFFGRLTTFQRLELARMSRKEELALAVLDEILLLFLANERDARLPSFLRCALPFATLNPYLPFQAGDVPPEMFFGREDMARELQRAAGSCVVYGGRQLGKSALLRHVQRQFHHTERKQYAWVMNMKLIFDQDIGRGADFLWLALRDRFIEHKLLSDRISTAIPDRIRQHLFDAMQADPGQRVLVMLDEADDFLDADAGNGFRETRALQDLMLQCERRLKVVFTGLHNVQRFQDMPNQPLAHFGTPLCVGPLEPFDAHQLVREPLETLGFRFEDRGAILRILSYTNYHPGLIQLFCQALLKNLHQRAISQSPPLPVTKTDVESVYRNQEVRNSIRERFDWTLALDARYQAIAWSMIEDQMERRADYESAYTHGQISKLVRGWWPQGFEDINVEELRGLLDEMVGLGVLVRTAEGRYRLRSPNLVRLMGTEEDIEARLLELSLRHPEPVTAAGSHHAHIGTTLLQYSPLTYAEEGQLNPPLSGVSLVFASEAQGLSTLPAAFKNLIQSGQADRNAVFVTASQAIRSGKALVEWLEEQKTRSSGAERLLVLHRPRMKDATELREMVQAAQAYCQRPQRRKDPVLRLLFLFDPAATRLWFTLAGQRRSRLEEKLDSMVFPRPWNARGLSRRLDQHERMHSDEVCREILRVTGGWHFLINALLKRLGREDDPRPHAQWIESELAAPESEFRQGFRMALGWDPDPIAQRVWDFIQQDSEQDSGVPEEFVQPDFIDGTPPLTQDELESAVQYLFCLGFITRSHDSLQPNPIVKQVLAEE
jgi:hypothetical protein